MKRLSLLDKLKIFWDVSQSSYLFAVLLIVLIILAYIFLATNKKNAKKNKMIYIGVTITVLVFITFLYQSSIKQLLDYLIDNLFISILYPNFAIYFAMMIIMNIIVWISIFRFQTSEIIKRINIIIYIIMNYLLALIIKVVDTSKISILNKTSVFSNQKATALIELSSMIFIIWIIYLIIYKIILVYIRKDYKPKVKKVIVNKKILPENFEPLETPRFIIGNMKKNLSKNYESVLTPNLVYGNINKKSLVLEDEQTKKAKEEIENLLTLDDYRLLLKILRNEKEKELEELKMKKAQEELNKQRILEMKKQEELREQEKYTELEMLYRSMR